MDTLMRLMRKTHHDPMNISMLDAEAYTIARGCAGILGRFKLPVVARVKTWVVVFRPMCRNQPLGGWLCKENFSWEALNECEVRVVM
jgi:hypothetical protein